MSDKKKILIGVVMTVALVMLVFIVGLTITISEDVETYEAIVIETVAEEKPTAYASSVAEIAIEDWDDLYALSKGEDKEANGCVLKIKSARWSKVISNAAERTEVNIAEKGEVTKTVYATLRFNFQAKYDAEEAVKRNQLARVAAVKARVEEETFAAETEEVEAVEEILAEEVATTETTEETAEVTEEVTEDKTDKIASEFAAQEVAVKEEETPFIYHTKRKVETEE